MRYKLIERCGVEVSMLALGGHEYLPNRLSRGFNEDFEKAITPGYIFPGFGGPARRGLVAKALDLGINYFDVTHDSEKEALGRNLRELGPLPYEIFVQTRPEGFCYTYDERNAKMADYGKLRAEVLRILALIRRERIDFFNIAFMKDALDHDPEYLAKVSDNIARLKAEGLVRFVCADTFSGESTYLAQIASGAFDVVYMNFNFADCQGERKVLGAAAERGMGVVDREAFMKGALFDMAREAGVGDRTLLAHAAMKWVLSHQEVSTLVYGTGNPSHLADAASVLEDLALGEEEMGLINRIKETTLYKSYFSKKKTEFLN